MKRKKRTKVMVVLMLLAAATSALSLVPQPANADGGLEDFNFFTCSPICSQYADVCCAHLDPIIING